MTNTHAFANPQDHHSRAPADPDDPPPPSPRGADGPGEEDDDDGQAVRGQARRDLCRGVLARSAAGAGPRVRATRAPDAQAPPAPATAAAGGRRQSPAVVRGTAENGCRSRPPATARPPRRRQRRRVLGLSVRARAGVPRLRVAAGRGAGPGQAVQAQDLRQARYRLRPRLNDVFFFFVIPFIYCSRLFLFDDLPRAALASVKGRAKKRLFVDGFARPFSIKP